MSQVIRLKVISNACKNEVVLKDGDFWKVKIKAPPERGKANRELVEFLAKEFNVKKSSINIIKGGKNKNKIIEMNL